MTTHSSNMPFLLILTASSRPVLVQEHVKNTRQQETTNRGDENLHRVYLHLNQQRRVWPHPQQVRIRAKF